MRKLAISLLVCAVAALTSCVDYEEVEVVDARGLKISGKPPKDLKLSADVKIRNPNSFSIDVTSAEALLYIDGSYAGRATLDEGFKMEGESEETFNLSATAVMDSAGLNMIPVMASLMFKKEVELRAEGNVKARSFLFGKSVAFDESETISLRD